MRCVDGCVQCFRLWYLTDICWRIMACCDNDIVHNHALSHAPILNLREIFIRIAWSCNLLHSHVFLNLPFDRIFTTWHEHALLCMIMQSILCVASGFSSLCMIMQSAACSCILNIALDWNYHTLHDHAVLEHARAVNCACCVWFMRHKHGRAVLCMIMSYLHLLLWVLARLCNNPQPLPPWSWITTLHAYAHGSLLNFYLYKYLLYYIIYYSLRTMNHSSVGMCSHE